MRDDPGLLAASVMPEGALAAAGGSRDPLAGVRGTRALMRLAEAAGADRKSTRLNSSH